MANMYDLESKRKLSYHSNFGTRSLNVLQLLETIFGPVPFNPSVLKIALLMKIGPVLILFPMLILLLIPPSSRVSCLVLM